jgi:histidyl-tRNA synthetase
MGDVTIKDVLEIRGLLPKSLAPAHLGIAVLSEESTDYAVKIAKDLRSKGIDTSIHYANKKIGDQIKFFDKKNIPFVAFVGDDEKKTDKIKIKDLRNGNEKTLDSKDTFPYIKENL